MKADTLKNDKSNVRPSSKEPTIKTTKTRYEDSNYKDAVTALRHQTLFMIMVMVMVMAN